MGCKLVLDESLYRGNFEAADRAVEELARSGIDAVYIGQPIPGFERWGKQNPDYVDALIKLHDACKLQYQYNVGHTDLKKPALTQEFKTCLNKEQDIPLGGVQRAKVPPRGTADKEIRRFAEQEQRLIVSRDRGRDLESTVTDRVALTSSEDQPPPTSDEILARLKSLGLCGL